MTGTHWVHGESLPFALASKWLGDRRWHQNPGIEVSCMYTIMPLESGIPIAECVGCA